MSKRSRYQWLVSLIAMGVMPFVAQPVWSAGFALAEQNVSSLGTAYAGAASIAEDASTGYYNAAGLTRLREEQIALSGVWIGTSSSVKATRSTATFSDPLTVQPGVGTVKPKGDAALVPGLHYANRLSDSWVFGLNITSPFGLKTKYKIDSLARYTATRSELNTINIGPSLAFAFQNGFSFGAGVDAMYVTAKLDSQVGIGTLNNDGFLQNTASNWGLGYHAGLLYEFTECTRLGLNYRSMIKVRPKGESVFQFLPGGVAETRLGVRTRVKLPESATASLYHAFNDQWAIMADVTWTHWTRFKTLSLRYIDDGSRLTYLENFKNAVRSSLGISYQWDECLRLRVGSAFDKTPTKDAYRSIRIPDQNRIWGAVGAQYRFSKCFALDVGYAHLFFKKAHINEAAPTLMRGKLLNTQPAQNFTGTGKARADLIGIQLTWDLV